MNDNGVIVHWWDVGAVVLWALVLALAVAASADGKINIEGFWALLLAPLAAGLTMLAIHRNQSARDYQRGLDNGLEHAGIIRLPANK